MYKVIIVGAGPSGLTCAKYLLDAGIDTLVINDNKTRLEKATISNFYPFKKTNGIALFNDSIIELKKAGLEIVNDSCIDINIEDHFIVKVSNNIYESEYLVLAMGSKDEIDKKYIKYLGTGVSVCALCDGPLYRNKKVYLTGNKKTIDNSLKELKHFTNDIELINEEDIFELIGENGLEGIKLNNGVLIPTNNLFLSLLPGPKTLYYKLGLTVKENLIKTNEFYETNINRLYAVGDLSNKIKQVASAVYSGMVSGIEITKRIKDENNR